MTLSTLLGGSSSTEAKKLAVWSKGIPIPGYDPIQYRRDVFGYVTDYSQYGNRQSDYGWEFDHYPTAKVFGGSDDIPNLRPLHYRSNASLGGALGNILNR